MELEALEQLVRRRRTNLRVDPAVEVPTELIERICAAATWAPNHHRSWPWRFAALTGDARSELGERTAAWMIVNGRDPDDPKVDKTRTKYLRAPLVLLVASDPDPTAGPARRVEDRDATAAAIQTLLLVAEAAGLATFWGTGPVTDAPAVRDLCRFEPGVDVLGALYIGWPVAEAPVPERPGPRIAFVDGA